jgi:signal transduction histidine kinase
MEACEGIKEPKIEVRAEKIGDNIRITVSDNGHGISTEVQDKIFIPFYSTKAHGSGIGLSLCRQIVIRHKGKISVQSDSKRTNFKIEFPLNI